MPGVLNRTVFSIGLASASASAFNISDIEYDYAINGQPFLAATSANQPLLRKLVPINKQQFDNSQDPGEQSLTGWWLRSQSSWHAGAGLIYQEPKIDPLHNYRFSSSAGVDVWTPGKLSLLKTSTRRITASGSCQLRGVSSGATNLVLMADGTTLRTWDGTTAGTITWGGAATIDALADDGTNYYAADNVGIWKGALPSTAGTKIWNTGTSSVTMEWCKQRLVAGIGPSIYELVGTGPTLPAAKYTHQNPSWVWTSITDSPAAILCAGHAGNQSAIYKFTLGSDGTMPTLSAGTIVAELPKGEIVNSICTYMGVYLGIFTSAGVRVATVDGNGSINVGPLSVKLPGGVKAGIGYDRYLYFGWKAGVDGYSGTTGIAGISGTTSGLGRLDLSLLTASIQTFSTGPITGHFAYTTDTYDPASAQTGDITSVVVFGNSGLMAYSLDGYGLCVQNANTYFTSGFVQGGRIRYDTLEPKVFKYVRLRSAVIPTGATESVDVIDQQLTETPVISYSAGQQPVDDVLISSQDTNQENMAVKLTMTSDGTAANQPVVYGW